MVGTQLIYVALITFMASGLGTIVGFGTSTVMVPALLIIFPLPETLLFVAIIHSFGNVWKMLLFREGIRWRFILTLGIPGTIASFIGASLSLSISKELFLRILGIFLILYVFLLYLRPCCQLQGNTRTAVAGGASYGFVAGIIGIGGEIRTAVLSAFNLDKAVYIATAGAVAMVIDFVRIATYTSRGVTLDNPLLSGLAIFITISLLGSAFGRRVVNVIPQERFRSVVAGFLFLAGLKLAIIP